MLLAVQGHGSIRAPGRRRGRIPIFAAIADAAAIRENVAAAPTEAHSARAESARAAVPFGRQVIGLPVRGLGTGCSVRTGGCGSPRYGAAGRRRAAISW